MSKNVSQGKPLTAELIFTKTKSDSLHNIKNLNLWGNDLEDLSLIDKMPALEVVSLSVNRICTLKYFACCNKLQQLYLRKNNIADLREIRYLIKLPALKVLWLHDNPCAQVEGYRDIVLKYLPNLVKLDNNPVTPEDKQKSQAVTYNLFGNQSQQNYRTQSNQSVAYSESGHQRPSTGSSQRHQQSPAQHYEQKNFSQQSHHNSSHHHQPQSQQGYRERERDRDSREQEQRSNKKAMQKRQQIHNAEQNYLQSQQNLNRNQNILMAILSLMRQLDSGSLEIVRREADKMLD